MPKTIQTWDGGYIRVDARGRDVYVIRRMVAGRRYEVSTRCHTSRAAHEQLRRFEEDPGNYRPGGGQKPGVEPIYLDQTLAEEFLAHSRDVKHNDAKWVAKQKDYLAWWGDRLEGLNLRKVSLTDHIKPALKTARAEGHRIAVIKALYSFLRKEKHVLNVTEDPTFQTLVVPQARPEQWKRPKAIPREHYLLAQQHLTGHWPAAMTVQAGTGWHLTETQRFAQSGSIEPYPTGGVPGIAGVLVCPRTKGGELLRTAVSQEVLEAGRKLLAHGSLSIERYAAAIKAACGAAGIPVFTPGRFRHSVATWAINNGADPAMVAAFLNHKSPRTTMRFYATHAVPRKVPTLA